jgi:uncharacterized SAM-binding protein YcdF (DUF218 family)
VGLFYPVSKVFGFLILPSHVLLWLVLGTAAALLLGRIRTARALALAAAALFVLVGAFPLGALLAQPLEERYPRRPLPAHIDGVVTLGAGLGAHALLTRGAPGWAASIDRVVSTYQLAREHPEARIVFSGGAGPYADAIAARDDFLRIGLNPARLTIEGKSRNTYENLAFSKQIVQPRPGQVWVLATAAIQLPRAMGVARRLGWQMIPWPTEYKTFPAPIPSDGWFYVGDNLRLADEAVHEWIGLPAYSAARLGSKS